MKIFFRRIHLYLSLGAGLVILIACLTGAILVFEKDLQMSLNKERYFVEAGEKKLSADSMAKLVKDSFPGAKVNGIKLYEDAERSAEINIAISSQQNKKKSDVPVIEKKSAPQRQPSYTIFINPYTGQILDKYSYRETWFYSVFALHRWLMGGEGSIGKYIVGISTLIFLFILISGIVLWWPKTRKILQQRLRIKWNSGWKRINHDLHLVFGFYSALFLFIIAFTGLAWSFEWFNKGIYKVTGSTMKPIAAPKSVYSSDADRITMEQALLMGKSIKGNGVWYNLQLPKDSSEAYTVSVLGKDALHENATDAIYIDQYTGKVAGSTDFAQRSLGARVRSTFKPVHTGSIWGTPTKVIAFIVCLFGVSFPITGVIMWINRVRKKRKYPKSKIADVGVEAYVD